MKNEIRQQPQKLYEMICSDIQKSFHDFPPPDGPGKTVQGDK